jgi:pyrroline-5-carboxylate reductase
MPNLPLVVGKGTTAICSSKRATKEEVKLVCALFGCLGVALEVDEIDMDTVCALSGSGPAYVAAMIESLSEAGRAAGLTKEVSQELVINTVYGSASLLKETGQDPAEFRTAVSSPGGTTLAALEAMNKAGYAEIYAQGVKAAIDRSKELEESL